MKYLAKISDREFSISLQNRGDLLDVRVAGESIPVELMRLDGSNLYLFFMNNQIFEVEIHKNEVGYFIHHRGQDYKCYVEDERLKRLKGAIKTKEKSTVQNEIKSPMPGLVVAIEVEVGQKVQAGQGLLIIEAMKMENEIRATGDAIIKEIKVELRQAVEMNQVLVVLGELGREHGAKSGE